MELSGEDEAEEYPQLPSDRTSSSKEASIHSSEPEESEEEEERLLEEMEEEEDEQEEEGEKENSSDEGSREEGSQEPLVGDSDRGGDEKSTGEEIREEDGVSPVLAPASVSAAPVFSVPQSTLSTAGFSEAKNPFATNATTTSAAKSAFTFSSGASAPMPSQRPKLEKRTSAQGPVDLKRKRQRNEGSPTPGMYYTSQAPSAAAAGGGHENTSRRTSVASSVIGSLSDEQLDAIQNLYVWNEWGRGVQIEGKQCSSVQFAPVLPTTEFDASLRKFFGWS